MSECALFLLASWSILFSPALLAAAATSSFTVNATITNGCAFGTSLSSPVTSLGTINFGSFASIPTNVDVVSTSGAGSVVVT